MSKFGAIGLRPCPSAVNTTRKPSRGLATLRVKIWCDRAATLSKCCRYHTKTEQGFSNFACQNLVRWGCDAVNVLFIPHENRAGEFVSQKTNRKPRLPQEFGRNSYPKRKIASPVPLRVYPKRQIASPVPLKIRQIASPVPLKSLEEIGIPKDKSQAPSPLRVWKKFVSQKTNRKPRPP